MEETHSSGYFVDDNLNTRTSPWWTADLRLGWDGMAGSVRLRPFVGFNNLFNRAYISSVVINAALGRYYEPLPAATSMSGSRWGGGVERPAGRARRWFDLQRRWV